MAFDFATIGSQASQQAIMYGFLLMIFIIFGLAVWFIIDFLSYNIHVELLRQTGQAFLDDKGQKKILTNTETKRGKLYQKKQKSGGSIEYFKIRGTNWDYKNYFQDSAFNPRTPGFGDFKKRVIRLFVDQEKGLVPIYLSNPGFAMENISLNETIGAISDSLHERDNLYSDDFWNKYGGVITMALLITFLVLGMIFVLKYQEIQWKNSMQAMESLFQAMKNQAAPPLESALQ